jgi:predicted CoA-binding protein
MKKKVLVIGASQNPERFSFIAIKKLLHFGHEVVALGAKSGMVDGVIIETEKIKFNDIHTVTLYIGSKNQDGYLDYLLKLKPTRVIFNPGTSNFELEQALENAGIEVVQNCTLVMLDAGSF